MMLSDLPPAPKRAFIEERRAPRPGSNASGWSGVGDKIVARRRLSIVILETQEVWAFEAKDRLSFVHSARGRFDVDLSLLEIEELVGRAFLRVHRRWLVNIVNIRELQRTPDGGGGLWVADSHADASTGMRVPIARDATRRVRERLLEGTIGLRHK